MRRYDEPVEVRRGWVSSSEMDGQAGQEGPEQFLWRGRLWKVRAVVAQWIETDPWWLGTGAREARGELAAAEAGHVNGDVPAQVPARSVVDLLEEREVWRVVASAGRQSAGGGGVFDLSFSWVDASWRLVGCVD